MGGEKGRCLIVHGIATSTLYESKDMMKFFAQLDKI